MSNIISDNKSLFSMEFKLKKLKYALDILDKVKRTIDTKAFIAGGFAMSYYFDLSPLSNDIDIFFSSPNFELNMLGGSAFCQLKSIFGDDLNGANLETYCYNKRFTKIASIEDEFKVDFIQIKDVPDNRVSYVLEKFDINMSKIALVGCYGQLLDFRFTEDFQSGINSEKIVIEYNLNERKEENELQNEITKERVKKYKRRLAHYTIKEKL